MRLLHGMTIYVEVVFVLSDVEVDKECEKIFEQVSAKFRKLEKWEEHLYTAWSRECFKAGYAKGLKEARK